MKLQIEPSVVSGTFLVPPSKSQTVRAILFASLAEGESTIDNVLFSPDTDKLVAALTELGVTFHREKSRLRIEGTGGVWKKPNIPLDLGNSGIALRFLTVLSSLSTHEITLTGDESLSSRPMKPLLDALSQLGVEVTHPPVTVKGPLQSGSAAIVGGDSQPVSALLLAASFGNGPFSFTVKEPGETPWVELTLSWLDRFSLPYTRDGFITYTLPGKGKIKGFHYTVPGDFSTAAFPLVAALITRGEVTVSPLDFDDPQGDKKLIELLQTMGAHVEKREFAVTITADTLRGINVDMDPFIDALPVLAALGCFTKGKMRLYNAKNAREKECDRILCMAKELTKMGGKVVEEKEGLTIYESRLQGGALFSHQDHRVAMALSLAALGAKGTTTIDQVACIQKTYPTFVTDFQKRGALWQII